MPILYINELHITENAAYGIVAYDHLVYQNFHTIFGTSKFEKFLELSQSRSEFYIIDRAFHLICFIQKDKSGLTMRLTDFKQDVDNALDEYLKLVDRDWDKKDINKILRIAHEIKNDSNLIRATLQQP